MKRRAVLMTAIALAGVLPAARVYAQEPVYVVKAMLFSCPLCRAAESIDNAIERAAKATGGGLIHAPLPVDDDGTGPAYYALRSLPGVNQSAVRESLYKASQDLGVPLTEPFQVMVWMQTDIADQPIDWTKFLDAAQGDEVKGAMGRSMKLGQRVGVSQTPTYVVIKGGVPVGVFDPTSVSPANSLSAVRDAVLKKITEASQPTKTKP